MRGRLWFVLVLLIVWGALWVLTYTPYYLGFAESLALQRPGVYPIPDGEEGIRMIEGQPYIPQTSVFIQYMVVSIGIWLACFYWLGKKNEK